MHPKELSKLLTHPPTMSPVWFQVITWTNADILSIGSLVTNFSETWIKIRNFSFMKMHLKMSSAKCQSFVQGAWVDSLRPRQNGRHIADDIFKCIFLNENVWILIKISLKFVPKGPINNIPALVQIMAWRRPGDKPLSESMMANLPTHICVTRPQWVNVMMWFDSGFVKGLAG